MSTREEERVLLMSGTCICTCVRKGSTRVRNVYLHVCEKVFYTCQDRVSTREGERVLHVSGSCIYTCKKPVLDTGVVRENRVKYRTSLCLLTCLVPLMCV